MKALKNEKYNCGNCKDENNNNYMHDGLSCGCGNCYDHSKKHSDKKNFFANYGVGLGKIFVSTLLIVFGFIFSYHTISLLLFILSTIVVGYELLYNFIKTMFKGAVFNENMLMLVASVTAFILGEFFEGALIVLLYTVGEFLEEVATDNAREKITDINKIRSSIVHIYTKNGIENVQPNTVSVGSLIEVKCGETIPIDGVLLSEFAELDVKAITGESVGKSAVKGEVILSGAINLGGPIVVKTTKIYKDSTVEKIISMVEGATAKKAKSQKFITTFAKYYTPIIVLIAILIAAVPPFFDQMNFVKWIYKALSFLVISCPCALVISVPLAYFVGIGRLAKNGILVKGSNYLEALSKCKTFIFDKTGTLTYGKFAVTNVQVEKGIDKERLIKYVVALEQKSNHPISAAIVEYFGKRSVDVALVKEYAGLGLVGEINGDKVIVGNDRMLIKHGVSLQNLDNSLTAIYVAINGVYVGRILLEDKVKRNAKKTIDELKKFGVDNTVILSGDIKQTVDRVACEIGINQVGS